MIIIFYSYFYIFSIFLSLPTRLPFTSATRRSPTFKVWSRILPPRIQWIGYRFGTPRVRNRAAPLAAWSVSRCFSRYDPMPIMISNSSEDSFRQRKVNKKWRHVQTTSAGESLISSLTNSRGEKKKFSNPGWSLDSIRVQYKYFIAGAQWDE